MATKCFLSLAMVVGLFLLSGQTGMEAQQNPDLHVVVNMVQLNVAVTDKNGNYITGLKPTDFAILEDGLAEKVATFSEGYEPAQSLIESAGNEPSADSPGEVAAHAVSSDPRSLEAAITGADVFILF